MSLTPTEKTLLAAGLAPAGAVVVAVLAALVAYLTSKRDRRRNLYSEAVKAATGWEELLYRVRRREKGQERDLIDRHHELQDQLSYYSAWIGSESRYMMRSYDRLIAGVKNATSSLISAAWSEPVRHPPGEAQTDDVHPDLSELTASFLQDVRSHLSPWFWRKLAVVWRNWKGR